MYISSSVPEKLLILVHIAFDDLQTTVPTVPTGLNPALGTAIFGAHFGDDAIGISVRSLTTAENFKFCAIVPLFFRDPLSVSYTHLTLPTIYSV